MKPAPPSHEISDEEEDLQEHVRIQLDLKEKKKEEGHVDKTQWPTPDVCPGREPYCEPAGYCSKELQIAHGIAPEREEDLLDVKQVHASKIQVLEQIFMFLV